MINFVITGIGAENDVQAMIKLVQRLFNSLCTKWNANVYNLDTLGRAESDSKLLHRKGRLSFSTTKCIVSKEYWGIIECEDYEELYNRWFKIKPCREYVPRTRWYYNRDLLKELVKEKFDLDYREELFKESDIVIRYEYNQCENNTNSYVVLQLSVDNNDKIDPNITLIQFNDIIKMLDEKYPSVFASAYITNLAVDYPISHVALYEFFKPDDLSKYILGAEYAVYIGDILYHKYANLEGMQAEGFSFEKLKNGIMYTSDVCIDDFNDKHRKNLECIFETAFIPGYGYYDWDELCELEKRACPLPTVVHVYVDNNSWCSPLIMFSYKLDNKSVDFEAGKRLGTGRALLDEFLIS